MSRNLTVVSTSVFLCFALIGWVRGVGQAQTSATDSQSSFQRSEETRSELTKKAVGLVNELIAESASFSLVENQIYLQAKAVELLWNQDEARSRSLVQELIGLINAQQAAPAGAVAAAGAPGRLMLGAPDNYISGQRSSLISFLAVKDSRLALTFLRATRLPKPARETGHPAEDPETSLELQLAAQVAENDPATALDIAEEALKKGLDARAIEIWSRLLKKDSPAAARLSHQLMSRLKAAELMKDGDQFQLATMMLQELGSRLNAKPEKNAGSASPDQVEMQRSIRELLELLVEAMLKVTSANLINTQESDRARNLLSVTQAFLPEIEKYLPGRATAAKAKLAQFEKAFYSSGVSFKNEAEFRKIEEKSTDELMELAAKAPENDRQAFIYFALSRAKNQTEADQIVKYASETLKMELEPGVIEQVRNRQAMNGGGAAGSLEEARSTLANLPSDEQRANFLAGGAAKAAATGDVKNAQLFFDETRRLIGDQMQTRMQLEAQLTLARAALAIDVDKSFEIAQAAVERLNRLVAAGLEMAAFDGMATGELRLETSEAWNSYTGKFNETAVALARRDFDRTARLLKQWQPNEVRIMITLAMLQNMLTETK